MEELKLILGELKNISQKVDGISQQVSSLETRMDSMEKRMDSMEKRMDSMEKRMDIIEARQAEHSLLLRSLEDRTAVISATLANTVERLDRVEGQLTSMNKSIDDLTEIVKHNTEYFTKKLGEYDYELYMVKRRLA